MELLSKVGNLSVTLGYQTANVIDTPDTAATLANLTALTDDGLSFGTDFDITDDIGTGCNESVGGDCRRAATKGQNGHGNIGRWARPAVSSRPNMTFMFCSAWPDAPLTRLSIVPVSVISKQSHRVSSFMTSMRSIR